MNFSLKNRLTGFGLLFLSTMVSGCSVTHTGAGFSIDRVDPPFWWTGMKNGQLELVVKAEGIGDSEVSIDAADTKILSVTRPSNSNYLFIDLSIGQNQPAGEIRLFFSSKRGKSSLVYELRSRQKDQPSKGIDASDLIYLVFPDRFANGDPTNDVAPGMLEPGVDRQGLKARHGGDLKGITDHLQFIKELGTTALWINPILENNQDFESYHGYAATDHYKVDPRLGTNEQFRELVKSCHREGIKVIWDVVYNHWGNFHYLQRELPDSNWVHWFPSFTRTSYRAETLMDPYASDFDRTVMTDGWFDHHMPDLNQKDPHLAKYLIQQSIWWIEYAGLDAFRIDTYAYPDQHFMHTLNTRIRDEYPGFVLFGETWVQGSPIQAWFTEKNGLNHEFSSELQGVTDFQLFYAITKGLNEPFGWEEGLRRIQLTLAHDILYHNPNLNVTFLDNHDLTRYYTAIGEDLFKWKAGMAMMLTLRGIPSIYYGTEILMKNAANPDALVREDFPGGWPGDLVNKFTPEGRTTRENEAFSFIRSIGQWRKANPWIGNSRLIQFVPEENTYIYFRVDDGHTLLCAYNLNDKEMRFSTNRFSECLRDHTSGKDITTGIPVNISQSLVLPPMSVSLIELK